MTKFNKQDAIDSVDKEQAYKEEIDRVLLRRALRVLTDLWCYDEYQLPADRLLEFIDANRTEIEAILARNDEDEPKAGGKCVITGLPLTEEPRGHFMNEEMLLFRELEGWQKDLALNERSVSSRNLGRYETTIDIWEQGGVEYINDNSIVRVLPKEGE